MTNNKKPLAQIIWDYFCLVCEKLHRALAAVVGFGSRRLQKVLTPLDWSLRLILFSLVIGLIFIGCSQWLLGQMWAAGEWEKPIVDYFTKVGTLGNLALIKTMLLYCGVFFLLVSLLAMNISKLTLYGFKIAIAAGLTIWVWLILFILNTGNDLVANVEEFDKYTRNDFFTHWAILLVPVIGTLLFYGLVVCLKDVNELYKGVALQKSAGDDLFENITTMGKDPKYRSSWIWSFTMHASILIVPFLFKGCMLDGYRLPKGDGAQPQVVKIKKIKKKKVEQLVFNPNSAISYYVPEINKKVLEELEEQTENQYKSQSLVGKNNNKSGKPGWPNGMENAKVRFIRLKYRGGDWDQNMGRGADYNFLVQFKKMTGLNVASDTEAIEVMDIKRFPKKQKPPFLYITGKGGISLTSREIKQLRSYMTEDGGMLFADNGGGRFNQSFRSLMKRVFPDKNWIDIANDDYIYQQPFLFPSGAPPLWHHSGTRALGIKHNGRWIAFYHQGDINDAWQTGGSGVSEATQAQAFKMGINVVNYAFNQYMSRHYDK